MLNEKRLRMAGKQRRKELTAKARVNMQRKLGSREEISGLSDRIFIDKEREYEA
jgi:hypothetical protein